MFCWKKREGRGRLLYKTLTFLLGNSSWLCRRIQARSPYCIQFAVHETKQFRDMPINIVCCIVVIQGSVAQDLAGWRNQSDGSSVLPSDDDLGEGVLLPVRNRPMVISASSQLQVLTGGLSFRIVGHRIQSSEQRSKRMGRQKKRRCCKRAWRRR